MGGCRSSKSADVLPHSSTSSTNSTPQLCIDTASPLSGDFAVTSIVPHGNHVHSHVPQLPNTAIECTPNHLPRPRTEGAGCASILVGDGLPSDEGVSDLGDFASSSRPTSRETVETRITSDDGIDAGSLESGSGTSTGRPPSSVGTRLIALLARAEAAPLAEQCGLYLRCWRVVSGVAQLKSSDIAADTASRVGHAHYTNGDYHTALRFHHIDLHISEQLSDARAQARAHANLGLAHHALGHHATALKHHRRQLRLAESVQDAGSAGRAYGNMGNIYLVQGDHGEALKCFKQRLSYAIHTSDVTAQARSHMWMGQVYGALGRHNESILAFERARDKTEAHHDIDPIVVVEVYEAMAKEYLLRAEPRNAAASWQTAIKHARRVGASEAIMGRLCAGLGIAVLESNDAPTAVEYFQSALEHFARAEPIDTAGQREVLGHMRTAYARMGRTDWEQRLQAVETAIGEANQRLAQRPITTASGQRTVTRESGSREKRRPRATAEGQRQRDRKPTIEQQRDAHEGGYAGKVPELVLEPATPIPHPTQTTPQRRGFSDADTVVTFE